MTNNANVLNYDEYDDGHTCFFIHVKVGVLAQDLMKNCNLLKPVSSGL